MYVFHAKASRLWSIIPPPPLGIVDQLMKRSNGVLNHDLCPLEPVQGALHLEGLRGVTLNYKIAQNGCYA